MIHTDPSTSDLDVAAPPSAAPPPPGVHLDGGARRSAAATWVAATGSVLLFAAAVLFVAVRWDDLVPALKLTLIAAATGAVITGGRALRPTLPAVGDVVFNLGVLLVPVDVVAVARHLGAGWEAATLAGGVATTTAAWMGWRASGSVVLARAGIVGVAVAVIGLAATTAVPALVVLGVLALGAVVSVPIADPADVDGEQTPRTRAQILTEASMWWAGLVGVGLVLLPAVSLRTVPGSAEHRLAVLGARIGVDAGWGATAAIGAGLLAGAALVVSARRRRLPALAVVGGLTGLAGTVRTWAVAEVSGDVTFLVAAVVALCVEVAATRWRHDATLAGPLDALGRVVEVVSSLSVLVAGAVVVAVPVLDMVDDDPGIAAPVGQRTGLAFAVLAGMWIVADLRRRTKPSSGLVTTATSGSFGFATLGASLSIGASVALLTMSGPAVTFAAVAVSVAVVCAGRPWGRATAAAALLASPLGVVGHGVWLEVVLVTAAVLTAWVSTRIVGPDRRTGSTLEVVGDWSLAVLAGLEATWAVLARVDAAGFDAAETVAALVAVAMFAAGLVAVLTADMARGAGPTAGSDIDPTAAWTRALAALTALALGHALFGPAADDGTLVAAVLVSAGLIGTGAGALAARPGVIHASLAVVTVGGWIGLADQGVETVSPYAVPVAAQLLAAGVWARSSARRRLEALVSSWEAHAPGISVIGAATFVDRVGGAGGTYAVAAGAVAVCAVVVGARGRLIGPLSVGTALLLGVTAHESVAVTASVPTWMWLALGGSALLGAAVWLERHETSPVEAGRRLVDVIGERFD